MPIATRCSNDLSLVVWRWANGPAAATYAQLVRALTASAAAIAKQRRVDPQTAIFSVMAALGGDWRAARPEMHQALQSGYRRLGLRLAAAALAGSAARATADPGGPQANNDVSDAAVVKREDLTPDSAGADKAAAPRTKTPPAAAISYLAPPGSVYELDELYDRAAAARQAEHWRPALRLLLQAQSGYQAQGGLFEIHAADCLLNLSALAGRLAAVTAGSDVGAGAAPAADRSRAARAWYQRAANWATAGQLLYERWGLLGQASKAILNRVAALQGQGRLSLARRLAADGEQLSVLAGLPTLAADARSARLALEALVRPRPRIVKDLQRLQRFYGDSVAPERRDAYQHCRQTAAASLELAVSRQMITLVLKRMLRQGTPEGIAPLQQIARRCPDAAHVLLDTSFLELSARCWPVLAHAATALSQSIAAAGGGDSGDATAASLATLARHLQLWTADGPSASEQLRTLRPTELLNSRLPAVSRDAATRIAALAGNWEEFWANDLDQLAALAQLYVASAAALVGSDSAAAGRLLTAAADCSPDVSRLIADRLSRRPSRAHFQLARLWLAEERPTVMPDEARREKARLLLTIRQLTSTPSGRRARRVRGDKTHRQSPQLDPPKNSILEAR